NTPIDENTTQTRWIQLRNFFKHPFFDKDSRRRVENIFKEDAEILEKVHPEILAVDLSEEVSVKSDGLQMHFRRLRKKLYKKGWAIDVDKVNDKVKGRRAVVVPSPERKTPEGQDIDWVLPEVPVVVETKLDELNNDVNQHLH
ncbi:MAG: (2Fe-2S)-binding protein, partial [Zetaproteobacteria bacterium]|nr:(2Fe-2S)-binding protein [Pseudobdellovibrionaceae bacterium]